MCRKVKASYGQRGHGHNDGDARMGDVNRIMVITDVTSFEVFSRTVKKALRSQVKFLSIHSYSLIVCYRVSVKLSELLE